MQGFCLILAFFDTLIISQISLNSLHCKDFSIIQQTLIWFNGAKTEYAEITYTINGQVQDTLRYSTDDMDIISIKNPEKEYSIHVAYYDNDGNKYE